jgi:glycosyltransferase involved in cell wall biosynthesis
MDCSVVIPVYYNEGSLFPSYLKVTEVLENHPDVKSYEIVLVDDGSGDGSWQEMLELKGKFPRHIRLVKFTRNFGQLAAIKAGYRFAKGKCIINISADLQDPPDLIAKMLDEHYVNGMQIVVCTREDRDEGWYRKTTSRFFYRVMQKLTFPNMPMGGFDFTLASRNVVDKFSGNFEANNFWQGQILWTGYPVKFIPYKRLKRLVGRSRWTFSKKIKYLLDGVMAYSYFPLRFMTLTGMVLFFFGVVYAAVIILMYFLGDVPFRGWAPIMILILLLSGIQMLMLGIIGEYLWRTLDQVRGRPEYIVEQEL